MYATSRVSCCILFDTKTEDLRLVPSLQGGFPIPFYSDKPLRVWQIVSIPVVVLHGVHRCQTLTRMIHNEFVQQGFLCRNNQTSGIKMVSQMVHRIKLRGTRSCPFADIRPVKSFRVFS